MSCGEQYIPADFDRSGPDGALIDGATGAPIGGVEWDGGWIHSGDGTALRDHPSEPLAGYEPRGLAYTEPLDEQLHRAKRRRALEQEKTPPSGWFADPVGRHAARYRDAYRWTERVRYPRDDSVNPPVTRFARDPLGIPAAWYSDPLNAEMRRYFDGASWTTHVEYPHGGRVHQPELERVLADVLPQSNDGR
ncbi:MAG TPA: DUF2510 domain-containing protein [Acidothermaceae bacterium]